MNYSQWYFLLPIKMQDCHTILKQNRFLPVIEGRSGGWGWYVGNESYNLVIVHLYPVYYCSSKWSLYNREMTRVIQFFIYFVGLERNFVSILYITQECRGRIGPLYYREQAVIQTGETGFEWGVHSMTRCNLNPLRFLPANNRGIVL